MNETYIMQWRVKEIGEYGSFETAIATTGNINMKVLIDDFETNFITVSLVWFQTAIFIVFIRGRE